MKIFFNPIGIVHNAIKARHAMPCQGVPSVIHIDAKYRQALYKIKNEAYLWILCYLHKAKRDVVIAKPKKSKTLNRTARGVFSIHSPDRPNPISLTKVKLLKRKGLVLYVDKLDIIDGTPVLDIKSIND